MTNNEKMTFTILAPSYAHNSAGIRCLYILSTLLSELGHDTYIDNYQQPGIPTPSEFKGIPITDGILRGIPILPEVFSNVNYPHVRWALNYPGKLAGPTTYNENTMAVYYLDKFKDATLQAAKSGIIHKFCIGNIELVKPFGQMEKTLILWYRGKYSQLVDISKHENQIELTRFWPAEKQKYWQLLHITKELYSYDDLTGTAIEAYHCGVNVFIYNTQTNGWDPYIPEDILSEVFIDHEVDLEKTKIFVEQCRQWYNNLPK